MPPQVPRASVRRDQLVRLAIDAQFDYYDQRRKPGQPRARDQIAITLGVDVQAVTKMRAQASRLVKLAQAAEAAHVTRPEYLSRLARRLLLSDRPYERYSVHTPAHWWEHWRRSIFQDDGTIAPRNPAEVLSAAESFIATHAPLWRPDLTTRDERQVERPWSALASEDRVYAAQLLRALGILVCGPYNAAAEARDLLALLAPADLDAALGMVASDPGGARVLRAVERSLRVYRTDHELYEKVQSWVLQQPRTLIKATAMLPLLRTLCRGTRPHPDVLGLIADAANADLGLEQTASEQRSAAWIALELGLQVKADRCPHHDVLVAGAAARQELGPDGEFVEWDNFVDHIEQDAPSALLVRPVATIDTRVADRREHWRHVEPRLQGPIRALLVRILVAPCLIQRRTILEVFDAAGFGVQEAVGVEASRLLQRMPGDSSISYVGETAAYIAGRMTHTGTLRYLNSIAIDRSLAPAVRRLAILGLGDTVHRNQQRKGTEAELDRAL